jgi:membrane protein
VSFTFTFGAILILVLLLVGVSAAPGGLSMVGLEGAAANAFALLRWPILFAAVTGAIVLLYRYGPSRARPRWRWVSWGAVLTALAWILFSAVFSWFLANVANYSATYGTLGTAIAVMMWLYLSVVILLLGATLNAETERQLATDTTVGPVKPLGARGAIVADRLADGVPAR